MGKRAARNKWGKQLNASLGIIGYAAVTWRILQSRIGDGVNGRIARTKSLCFFWFAFTMFLHNETGLALIQWTLLVLVAVEAFD